MTRDRARTFFLTAGLLLALAAPASVRAAAPDLDDYGVIPGSLGGDFVLTNQHGKKAALKDFRGKVALIFFGYTFCPDVCPVTLAQMSAVHKALGAEWSGFQPLFVTIDPERDTPPRLKAYLTNFDPAIVGLTGSARAVLNVSRLYRVKFAKREADSKTGYLLDHTGMLYMLDDQGQVRYVFPYDVGPEVLAAGARHLLKPKG
jgi:protein SCO1/2